MIQDTHARTKIWIEDSGKQEEVRNIDWGPAQPNGGVFEECMVFHNGSFYDYDCDRECGLVCTLPEKMDIYLRGGPKTPDLDSRYVLRWGFPSTERKRNVVTFDGLDRGQLEWHLDSDATRLVVNGDVNQTLVGLSHEPFGRLELRGETKLRGTNYIFTKVGWTL